MKNIINNLKNNFLFQLSLGSKELFHSNLLGWLLDQNKDAFRLFINKYGGPDFVNTKTDEMIIFPVDREKGNLDIVVKWKQNNIKYHIIIENKMKSIPSAEQLEEYNDKISALKKQKNEDTSTNEVVRKLLLTPLSVGDKFQATGWENITYANDIVSFLQDIQEIKINNPDIPILISRYIDFIQNLTRILQAFQLENPHSLLSRQYDFYTEIILEEIREIRLHDFVLKLAHDYIAELISMKIEEYQNILIYKSYEKFKDAKRGILIHSGFSHSTGLTDIKVHLEEGQIIGLQLQENILKYYVEVLDKSKIKQNIAFANSLITNKKWFFDKNGEILEGKGEKKKSLSQLSEKKFYSYSDMKFMYLRKNFGDYSQKPIKELVEFLSEEVLSIIKNIDDYKSLILKS